MGICFTQSTGTAVHDVRTGIKTTVPVPYGRSTMGFVDLVLDLSLRQHCSYVERQCSSGTVYSTLTYSTCRYVQYGLVGSRGSLGMIVFAVTTDGAPVDSIWISSPPSPSLQTVFSRQRAV